MLFHITQGTITPGTFGYTGTDIDRVLALELAAWTVIAVALVTLDRGAWRTPRRDVVVPAPQRPVGAVLETSVVQREPPQPAARRNGSSPAHRPATRKSRSVTEIILQASVGSGARRS